MRNEKLNKEEREAEECEDLFLLQDRLQNEIKRFRVKKETLIIIGALLAIAVFMLSIYLCKTFHIISKSLS